MSGGHSTLQNYFRVLKPPGGALIGITDTNLSIRGKSFSTGRNYLHKMSLNTKVLELKMGIIIEKVGSFTYLERWGWNLIGYFQVCLKLCNDISSHRPSLRFWSSKSHLLWHDICKEKQFNHSKTITKAATTTMTPTFSTEMNLKAIFMQFVLSGLVRFSSHLKLI